MHAGTGIAFTAGTGDVEIFYFIAVFKGDAVDLTVAAHVHLHAFRQGVDHRNPTPCRPPENW
jgi:hypothetical protein